MWKLPLREVAAVPSMSRGLAWHELAVKGGSVIEGFESVTLRSANGSTEAEFVPSVNMVCCSLRQ